jgi:predicted nuclease of predicted toxin-antitoxin system
MSDEVAIFFFVDRSLGKTHVVNALRAIGEAVEMHDEHFEQAEADAVWLQAVAAKDWVVLTADKKIAYRHLERMAVEQSGAKVFALVSGNLSGADMAAIFVKAVDAMKSFVLKTPAPFIAKVYKDGRVKPWK